MFLGPVATPWRRDRSFLGVAMPYIEKERRWRIDLALNALEITDDGELNYAITKLCLRYLETTIDSAARYADYNAVMGVLTCAQLEFYRMFVTPYEMDKRLQNGPVTP